MPDLSYPAGKFAMPDPFDRRAAVEEIASLPAKLRAAAAGLTDVQLDTPYREGGWTPRQVVHHVADSHMNAFIRTKLTLTEDRPTIKPYDQDAWATLPDARLPLAVSLAILDAVHERWVTVLRTVSDAEGAREFVHPEHGGRTLDWMMALYAWHGRHHTGHILQLRAARGW